MSLPIRCIGDPVLREVSRPVSREALDSPELQQFIDELIATMRAAGGAGLAAVQVGRALRICVMEVTDNKRYPYMPDLPLRVLVNPELEIIGEERVINYDGCLSVPQLRGPVERPLHLCLRCQDRHGRDFQAEYKGLAAVIVSHECEHLDGVLFIDRVADPRALCSWENFRHYREQQEVEKWLQLQSLCEPAERIIAAIGP